jgi:hypothetical protein
MVMRLSRPVLSFVLALGMIGGFCASSPSEAASFDCTKAKSAHEKLICSTPDLNSADEEMGTVYRAVDGGFPIKGFMRSNQALFLLDYRACANDKAKDKGAAACLDLVRSRIRELQEIGAAKVYAAGDGPYDPSEQVILIGQSGNKPFLMMFGSWMPDAYRPKPFPYGFICNERFEMTGQGADAKLKDVDWEVRITDQTIEADSYSCSPRTSFGGSFKRLR